MQVQKIVLAMSIAIQSYALELQDFFIFDDWQQPVIFRLENQQTMPIDSMTLFFLGSNDCQSHYLERLNIEGRPIHLNAEQVFSLNTKKIYQATKLMNLQNKAHSVLIRFIRSPHHFAFFVEGCADQDINCCIPITCDESLHDCTMPNMVQPLYFE